MKGKQAALAANRREQQHESTERRLRAELAELRRDLERHKRAHADRDAMAAELARLKGQVAEGSSDALVAVQGRLRTVAAALDSALHTIAIYTGKAQRDGDEGRLTLEEWDALGAAFGPRYLREWFEAAGEAFRREGKRNLERRRGQIGAHIRILDDLDRQRAGR